MLTNFQVLFPQGEPINGAIDWPEYPDRMLVAALVAPYLAGEPFEYVRLHLDGRMVDMLIAEMGHVRLTTRAPLAINAPATAMYRDSYARLYPEDRREAMPEIAGAAIVFNRTLR